MSEEAGVDAELALPSSGVLRGFRIALGAACSMLVLGSIAARSGSRAWPFEVFSNLPIQFLVLGALSLFVAIGLRARTSIVLAVVCLALNLGPVVSTLRTDRRPAEAASQRMTFTSLNAQSGPIDVDGLRRHTAEERPAVLIVLDPEPQQRNAFASPPDGYVANFAGPRFRSASDVPRTAIWSRIPLTGVRHPVDRAFGRSAAEFSFRINGERVAFLAIGSDAPTSAARARERNRILTAAATWSRKAQDDDEHVIVMGDFNATKWSPVVELFRRQARLRDSLDGFGIQPSWPTSNPFFLVPIDNAYLSDELVTTDRSTGPSFGSLHRSLNVTVAAAAPE